MRCRWCLSAGRAGHKRPRLSCRTATTCAGTYAASARSNGRDERQADAAPGPFHASAVYSFAFPSFGSVRPRAAGTEQLLFLQFNGNLCRFIRLYRHRNVGIPGIVLSRDQRVIPGRNIRNAEASVLGGPGVIGAVRHVNPRQHPAMRVTLDANQAGSVQLARDSLPLIGQREIEGSAFAVEAMRVVQDRIGIDHIDRARLNHLHGRLESAFHVVDFRRFWRLAPCLAFGDLLQIDDDVLDTFVRPDQDQGLVSGTAADLPVFRRDDLLRGYVALKNDLALDLPAAGDGYHVVRESRNADDGDRNDLQESYDGYCREHGKRFLLLHAHDPDAALTYTASLRALEVQRLSTYSDLYDYYWRGSEAGFQTDRKFKVLISLIEKDN